MNQSDRLRAALAQIDEVASAAIRNGDEFAEYEHKEGGESEPMSQEEAPGCILKSLPTRLLVKAAETATRINPVNAPVFGSMAAVANGFQVTEPLQIAVLTSKYWGPKPRQLTVGFMESTPAALKARIISHMNAWTKTGCISLVGTNGVGDVRISRGAGGYWSYLGTDILHIPKNRPTMNLQGFTMSTPESEYKRVVRHETGHTLGFPHEHMRKALVARIDREKAYKWFWETYGWDKATVDAQVLTPLSEASLMGTPADQNSIMCYQLPGLITKDGKPILGGTDIDTTDYAFCGKIYPRPGHVPAARDEDWLESEDVEVTDWLELEAVAGAV
jgi:astacin (peptidase family M12A)